MTRIIVNKLVFNEFNLEHIKKHKITKEEVEEVGEKFVYHRRTYNERYLAIGRSGTRIITIVLKRLNTGVYQLVTARDSDKKERRALYEKERKQDS